jgi:uncharacterized ubiquitin-like protein YukD
MILVDIAVPSVNNVYDFQLDEYTPVGMIIEEIGELIEQKEHCQMVGDITALMLCLQKERRILPREQTLKECQVQTGNSLLLI